MPCFHANGPNGGLNSLTRSTDGFNLNELQHLVTTEEPSTCGRLRNSSSASTCESESVQQEHLLIVGREFRFDSEKDELVISRHHLPPTNAQVSSLPDVVRADRSESSGHGCSIKSGKLVSHTSSGYGSAQKPMKCYSICTNNSPEHVSCGEDDGELPQQAPQQVHQPECTIEGRIQKHSENYSQESGNEKGPIDQHSGSICVEDRVSCTTLLDRNHLRRDDLVTRVPSAWESGNCTNTHLVSDPPSRDEDTLPLPHQETQQGEDLGTKERGSVLLNPTKSLQKEGSNEQESAQEGQGDHIKEETQPSSSWSSIDSLRSKDGNFHTEGHNHDCSSQDGRNSAVCEHKLSVEHTPEEIMVSVIEGAGLSKEPTQQSWTESVTELLVPQPQSMPSDDKGLLVPPPWQGLPLSIRKNVVLPPLVLPSFMNSHYEVLPSSSTPVSKGVVMSQMPSKSVSKSLRSGYILYSAIFKVFEEGTYLPVPSQEAMKKSIGKGGNGVITNIYHKGMEFAAKKTHFRQIEVDVMSSLRSEFILSLEAVMMGEEDPLRPHRYYCYHFYPRMSGDVQTYLNRLGQGALSNVLMKHKDSPSMLQLVVDNVKHILRCVLEGMYYLHNNDIVHNDIKPSNFLVSSPCGCDSPITCNHSQTFGIKIGDFDSAMPVAKLQTSPSLVRQLYRTHPIGTPGYRPVEYVLAGTRSVEELRWDVVTSADLWSFGCSTLKMFISHSGPSSQQEMSFLHLWGTCSYPWSVEDKRARETLKVGLLKRVYPSWSQLWEFVEDCMKVVPTERTRADELLQHQFFSS